MPYKKGGDLLPIYLLYNTIKSRCHNPNNRNFYRYGGRGIVMFEQWRSSFRSFADYIKALGPKPTPKHSIDRINNDGNYEPGNIRWASRLEQAANTSKAKCVTHEGVIKTHRQWAVHFGISQGVLSSRIRRGIPFIEAIKP